jgi:hypothetical protein
MPASAVDEINDSKLTKITTLRLAVNYIAALTKMLEDDETPASLNLLSSSPTPTVATPAPSNVTCSSPPQPIVSQLPVPVTPSTFRSQPTPSSSSPTTTATVVPSRPVVRPAASLSSPYFAPGSSPVVQVVSSNAIACTYKMRLQPPPPPMSAAERAQQVRANGTFAVQRKRPQLQMHPYTGKRASRTSTANSQPMHTQHIFHTVYPNLASYQQVPIPAPTHHTSTFTLNQSTGNKLVQTSKMSSMQAFALSTAHPAANSTYSSTNMTTAQQSSHPITPLNCINYESTGPAAMDDFNDLNYGELDNWLNLDSASNSDSLDSLLGSCNSATSSQACRSNSSESEFSDFSLQTLFAHNELVDLY